MKIIQYSVYGFIYGILYGTVSYYLLSNLYRQHLIGIISCGVQGAILGLSFGSITFFTNKYYTNINKSKLSMAVIGALSGVVSSIPYIIVTIRNIERFGVMKSNNMMLDVVYGLGLYCIGSAVVGVIVGLAINLKNQ